VSLSKGRRRPPIDLPMLVAEYLVHRDAQDLGIAPLELGEVLLVRGIWTVQTGVKAAG